MANYKYLNIVALQHDVFLIQWCIFCVSSADI